MVSCYPWFDILGTYPPRITRETCTINCSEKRCNCYNGKYVLTFAKSEIEGFYSKFCLQFLSGWENVRKHDIKFKIFTVGVKSQVQNDRIRNLWTKLNFK